MALHREAVGRIEPVLLLHGLEDLAMDGLLEPEDAAVLAAMLEAVIDTVPGGPYVPRPRSSRNLPTPRRTRAARSP